MTSWNLSGWLDAAPISQTNHLQLEVVAAELRRLDPDIILLQHVGSSSSCAQLAEALKPSEYNLTICSAFGNKRQNETQPSALTNRAELTSFYEIGIRQSRADLDDAQKELAESRTSLGGISRELMAQGITNWSEVTSDIAKEYGDISRQIEMFGDQERDLRYRGYKEAHPLVQAVRGQLRTFATRKAEFDHSFPTLKFIVEGTNAPNWSLAQQLDEYRYLNLRVAALQNSLSLDEERLSQLVRERTEVAERGDDNPFAVGGRARVQVAILSKQKAYFSRSYAWESTNNSGFSGFSFAAIQTSKQKIGCFTVDFEGSLDVSASVRQLLAEMTSMRKAEESEPETFLLACTFGSPRKATAERQEEAIRVLLNAGFSDVLSGLAGEQGKAKFRPDCIFVESTGLALNPQMTTGPLTCDIELDPAKVTAGRLARVEAQTKVAFRDPQNLVAMWTVGLLFAAVSFLSLGWFIGRSKSWRSREARRLLPVAAERTLTRPSSYTVIVAPTSMTGSAADPATLPAVAPTVHVDTPGPGATQSGTWEQRALLAEHRAKRAEEVVRRGLLPHLSRWMRERFLRKLLVDRSQLLAAQEEATRKVMAVDARLNKLESQIQQKTSIYVKRIEELTAELLSAKEENRELIRAKITQVKIEMEAARKKLLDQRSKAGS